MRIFTQERIVRKRLLGSLVLVAAFGSAFAQPAANEVNPQRHSGWFATLANNKRFSPSPTPLKLEQKNLSPQDRDIAEMADRLIERNATTSVLLIERGQIIFEKYKAPGTQNSKMFSESMSKSLTALTIGKMYCDGKIPSLDRPAETYAPALEGLAMGESSIRDLLKMSSGAKDAVHAGSGSKEELANIRDGRTTALAVMRERGARDTTFFGNPQPSGKDFRYNATDSLALAEVADRTGGFFTNFDAIWKDAGAESEGTWLYDRDNRALAQAGVSATSRDWARLAMWSIKQLKSNDPCMSKFVKEATTPQINNSSKRIGKAFDTYGYQTWIGNFRGVPSYWWSGYGGQRVGVDPVTERIIVVTSYREDYIPEVYSLFGFWQRQ
jgi:CubicO group peptidase (beta-lactamase class C family)